MEDVWFGIMQELEVPKDISEKWWLKIVSQYSDSGRIYHRLQECVGTKVSLYKELVQERLCDEGERRPFLVALYFQHYEYDTMVYGEWECIDRNVQIVKEFFKDAGIKHEGLISSVVGLLGASREGASCNSSEGANAYFQDLELAPLGLPSEEYNKYIDDIRKEYSHMPSHLYTSLRLKVLQTLLLIPRIYSTKVFHERFEEIARQNIQCEIDQMLVS